MDINNKNVAILGIGVEGLALVDFLKDKNCRITLYDQKSEKELIETAEGEMKAKIESAVADSTVTRHFGEAENDLSGFDIVFRSPGINPSNPDIVKAKSLGIEISSQIKLFFDLCPCKIIGVTGTKGKGTTASLLYSILKKNIEYRISNIETKSQFSKREIQNNSDFGFRLPAGEAGISDFQQVYLAGNIGTPAITLIPKLKSDDIVILELSSFQLIDLEKSPHIAVVTNLDVDHLDYHKDENEYREAKFNILSHQTSGDFAVLNRESSFPEEWLSRVKSAKKYFSSFGKESEVFVENNDGVYQIALNKGSQKIKICDQNGIKLVGKHNLMNIAAATIVADILKVDPETITKAVSEFAGLPHRLEPVGEIDGVKYINDSFATNPGPSMAAIDSFDQEKILILGGSSKGADFSALAKKISESKIRAVILIGVEAEKIKQALLESNFRGEILPGGNSMEEIVQTAKKVAESGDLVIFSPACASFDMFTNYKDRGEKFSTAVLNLTRQAPNF